MALEWGLALVFLLVPIVLNRALAYTSSKGWSKFPKKEEVASVPLSYRLGLAALSLVLFFGFILAFYVLFFETFSGMQSAVFKTQSTTFFKTSPEAVFLLFFAIFLPSMIWVLEFFEFLERLIHLTSERLSKLLFIAGGGITRPPAKVLIVLFAVALVLILLPSALLFDKFVRVDETGIRAPLMDRSLGREVEIPYGMKQYSFDETDVKIYVDAWTSTDKYGTKTKEAMPHFDLVFADGNRVNIWEEIPLQGADVSKEELASLIDFLKEKKVTIEVTPLSEKEREGVRSKNPEYQTEIYYVFEKLGEAEVVS